VGPGFTGHATDVATGLTYMQQRYYDAELDRFLTPDPVGPEEDFIQHFNRYNYALNNPVRYTDPDGRCGGGGHVVRCFGGGGQHGKAGGEGKAKKSSVNSNSRQNNNLRNTPEQIAMLEKNDIQGYYMSRIEMGDKYGQLALDVINNEGLLGKNANMWLFRNVAIELPEADKRALLGSGTYVDFVKKVSIGLANAHARYVDADSFGVRGLLSSDQVSQYHEEYFQSLGLPIYTFGGSFFFGYRMSWWCEGCDKVP
jgi:RHS repeat-associated protein